ncbi:MAG: hypothetical protein NVSMB34_10750 [Variovorax sp.]
MRVSGFSILKVAALGLVFAGQVGMANAQPAGGLVQRPEWTLYAGHGVDANLLGIPKQIFSNDVKFEPSYFTAIGYGKPTALPDWLTSGLGHVGISEPTGVVEAIGVQHRGLQHNFEADLAFILRTGFAQLGPVRLRAGAGIGLSYAFGRPSYEDGPDGDPTRRYRFQNFNAIELEGGLNQFPDTGLVARVHHRSGLYGLVAPKHVGSNFLTVGIRHRF